MDNLHFSQDQLVQVGEELRKLSPGAEYFGSGHRFALENCGNRSINTLMIQDILKWSLSCNCYKQSQVTGLTQLSKDSALGDSLRSSTPYWVLLSKAPKK